MDAVWPSLLSIGALVLGWWLNEWSSTKAFKRQEKEIRRAVYQGAFVRLRKLQDSTGSATSFDSVRPLLEDLQTWWYSNSLSLDRKTNEALVGVVNCIHTNMLPEPRASNILPIDLVEKAFDEAEDAIRSATDQPRGQATASKRRVALTNKVSMYTVKLGVMLIGFSGLALVAKPAPFPGTRWVVPAAPVQWFGYLAFVAGVVMVIVSCLPKYSDMVEGFLERRPKNRWDGAAKYVVMTLISVVFFAGWLRAVGGAVDDGTAIGYVVFFGGLAVLSFLLVLSIGGRWLIRWR